MILGILAQDGGEQIIATSGISWANYDGSNNGEWTIISSASVNIAERNGIVNIGNTIAFMGNNASGNYLLNFKISGNTILGPAVAQQINTLSTFFQNLGQIASNSVNPNNCLITYDNGVYRTAIYNGTNFTLGTPEFFPARNSRGTTIKTTGNENQFLVGVTGTNFLATISGSSVNLTPNFSNTLNTTFYDIEINPATGEKGVELYTVNNHNAAYINRITWPNTRALLFASANGPNQSQEFLHVKKINNGKFITVYKSVNRYPIIRTVFPDSDTLGTQVIVENNFASDISYQQINSNWGILCYRVNDLIKSAIINTLSVDPQVINIFKDYTSLSTANTSYSAVIVLNETTLVQITVSPTSNLVARVIKL